LADSLTAEVFPYAIALTIAESQISFLRVLSIISCREHVKTYEKHMIFVIYNDGIPREKDVLHNDKNNVYRF